VTTAERLFWARVRALTQRLQPSAASALLRSFDLIRASMSDADLAQFVRAGGVERLFSADAPLSAAAIERAILPVKLEIRTAIETAFGTFARDLPGTAVGFNILNPRILDAVRTMETRVTARLVEDVQGAVRAYAEDALVRGAAPRELARHLREVVDLAPNQVRAVTNFRRMLESGDREALSRQLRDKRFDATLRKVLGVDGKSLSPDQVEKMTEAYRRKMVAHNAEAQARTVTLQAQKAGQRMSWEDAIERGVVPRERLMKQWRTVRDSRVRPEHQEMEGEVVHFDAPFSNGQIVPGESDWLCRCLARYFLAAKAKDA
jgi:hypothetical protein